MDWVWTWRGECFGYFDEDNLWTYDGKNIGRRDGDEIYGSDGHYLGEVRNDNRLITNIGKKSHLRNSFTPYANRVGCARYANYVGYVMYAGYEDFPSADEF
jgi:hypothetical protein